MEKVKLLLKERDVGCTLRKQPKAITEFFYARLAEYSRVVSHPLAHSEPRKSLKHRLFTFLKFIGKPNDVWRKEELIRDRWPELQEDLKQVL